MGGMGVACVIAVCEFVWKSRKVAVEERVSGFGYWFLIGNNFCVFFEIDFLKYP